MLTSLTKMGRRYNLRTDRRGLVVFGGRDGLVFAIGGGLGDVRAHEFDTGLRCIENGFMETQKTKGRDCSFGSRKPVLFARPSTRDPGSQADLQHEQKRRLL